MTEYNYSPDAERHFHEKMGSVGRWAAATGHERQNYRVPFGNRSDAGDESEDDSDYEDGNFEYLRSPSVVEAPTYHPHPALGSHLNIPPAYDYQRSNSSPHLPLPSFGQAFQPQHQQPVYVPQPQSQVSQTYYPQTSSSTTTMASPYNRYAIYPSQRFSPVPSVATTLSPMPPQSIYTPTSPGYFPPHPQPQTVMVPHDTQLRSVASSGRLRKQHSRSFSAVPSIAAYPYYPMSMPTTPFASPPMSPIPMAIPVQQFIVVPPHKKAKKRKHRSHSRSRSRYAPVSHFLVSIPSPRL
ncbi:hypothetical protein DL96DRAFT_1588093 [Flagelloscypha sp. PMI_526]|nr:hypothetical protein DL96DRAFT_1588093 [Flagelloscypha sp. PMI_526]